MASDGEARSVSDGWLRRRARISFEIERAALELFASRSADEVTVEEIARAAGISKRTFFRYFPSRDDVIAALPMRHVRRLCERFAARPPGEAVLDAFIAAVIEEDAEETQDDLILLWGRAVLPVLPPEEGRVTNSMVDAYGAVIAARTGLHPDDARVQVWATAIASISGWAFLRWLEVGGNRSVVLVDSLAMLGDLTRAGAGSAGTSRRPALEKTAKKTAAAKKTAKKTAAAKKTAPRKAAVKKAAGRPPRRDGRA
ncbi:MAG: TetR family transcriptional regulator [Acidimicrobiia bacterium]